MKKLEQNITESQRKITNDSSLQNAALLRFLLEQDNAPPPGLELTTDLKSSDEATGTEAQQQKQKQSSDLRGEETIFWSYRTPITLASFELELRSQRVNIVNDEARDNVGADDSQTHLSGLSVKKFDFLLYFLQQVCISTFADSTPCVLDFTTNL